VNIGDRIRTARKAVGLSQEEVARRAGLSLKGMGEIERGDIEDPHISSLMKIARALSVPVEELLEEPVPLAEAAGRGFPNGLPNTVEELLARRNTKTRHLADPHLAATLADTSRPLADILQIVREVTAEIEATRSDLVHLGKDRGNPEAQRLFEEAARQIATASLALPARRGQKFVPIQPEASTEPLPELPEELKADLDEAERKFEEARRPLLAA